MQQDWLKVEDFLIAPFYILLVLGIGNLVRTRKQFQEKKDHYRYLLPALLCKIVGAISLCMIYTYYYEIGGDVTNYFITTKTYVNILLSGHFGKFFEMVNFRDNNVYFILASGNTYGYVMFNPEDYYALFTVVLTIPVCLLAAKSFLATAVLLAGLSFIGLWKLYEVFVEQFPQLAREFAISIFFVPSVFFWGSGILKDTYTLSAIGFFIFGLYRFQIQKRRKLRYLLMIFGASVLFLNIKPYFLFALLPGSLLWIYFHKIKNIRNELFRALFIPLLVSTILVVAATVFGFLGDYLGEYSLDRVLQKAVKTQQDLVRDAYGSNSYDIGVFEPTIASVARKIPAALNLALFRPYLWDVRNPVMALTAIENTFMLCFTIYILLRVRFTVLLTSLQSHPLLVFSLLFALFFAFSVGLTTANYGALSRLKIPCIPFYMASLFIVYELNRASFGRRSARTRRAVFP